MPTFDIGQTISVLAVAATTVAVVRALSLDLRRRAREAEALARATCELVVGTAERDTLNGILAAAMQAVPATVASFIVPASDGGSLRVAAILGGPGDWVGRSYPASVGISGRAWRNVAVERVHDVTRDHDYSMWTPETRSALAVPVHQHGRARGLIYFEDRSPGHFTDRDVRLMHAFADHAWVALDTEDRRRALEVATDRHAAAFNAVPSAVVITRAADARIVDANDAFMAVVGRTRAEVIGRTANELGILDKASEPRIAEQLGRHGRVVEEIETDALGHGTQTFLTSAVVTQIAGQAHVVTVAVDITERKRIERENERLALYDPLTGLPNRNQFTRRLAKAIATAMSSGGSVAVLLVDIDHFQEINDTFGHVVGDDLLRSVALRLRAAISADAIVARLGGDKFGIVLENDVTSAPQVAEAARLALEMAFEVGGRSIVLTGAVGLAFFPEHAHSTSRLLQKAEIALHAAQSTGAGTTTYAAAIDLHSPARIELAAELQRAIGNEQIRVEYEPSIPLRPGQELGVEALARWTHPTRGPIPPSEFVPAAERSGLMKPLTKLVLDAALARAAEWRSLGIDLEIGVNISMHDLRDVQLADLVARKLERHGFPAERLVLELTESVAMADADHTLLALSRLRALGVRIAIDDFGTGYSSLAYLRRLPVDALKIDRSFVAGLARDSSSTSIVRATIELGHALGLTVIAEGVEDVGQLESLRALGCDRAQGYVIARSMPAEQLPRWLRESRSMHGIARAS